MQYHVMKSAEQRYTWVTKYYKGGEISFNERQDYLARTIIRVKGAESVNHAAVKALTFLSGVLPPGDGQNHLTFYAYEPEPYEDTYVHDENEISLRIRGSLHVEHHHLVLLAEEVQVY